MTTRKPARREPLPPSDDQLRDEFWSLARRTYALRDKLPSMPGTFPVADHQLDCYNDAVKAMEGPARITAGDAS